MHTLFSSRCIWVHENWGNKTISIFAQIVKLQSILLVVKGKVCVNLSCKQWGCDSHKVQYSMHNSLLEAHSCIAEVTEGTGVKTWGWGFAQCCAALILLLPPLSPPLHTNVCNVWWQNSGQPLVWRTVYHRGMSPLTEGISSVQSLSRVRLFATPWIAARQAPCPSPTPGVHSDSRPSSQWCHPAISSSVVPFVSCPQPLPASESFPMSQLFTWGGQNIGVSASASFPPKKPQGWSPSKWTGWISLQSKGLSRVFSNTTVQKHQFLGAQPSSQSNSHIHTWPQEKP